MSKFKKDQKVTLLKRYEVIVTGIHKTNKDGTKVYTVTENPTQNSMVHESHLEEKV